LGARHHGRRWHVRRPPVASGVQAEFPCWTCACGHVVGELAPSLDGMARRHLRLGRWLQSWRCASGRSLALARPPMAGLEHPEPIAAPAAAWPMRSDFAASCSPALLRAP
jgi:hypothetical protein